jgi:hypothetical protein
VENFEGGREYVVEEYLKNAKGGAGGGAGRGHVVVLDDEDDE